MKIELWTIGKNKFPFLKEGIEIFEKRINRFNNFSIQYFPDVKNPKNLSPTVLKRKEAEIFLKKKSTKDFIILLDENGKEFTSRSFAKTIETRLQHSHQSIIFIIGGAYGFDQSLYDIAHMKIKLSSMTFSHQMIRLIFVEQLYRAFSIINGLPYHND